MTGKRGSRVSGRGKGFLRLMLVLFVSGSFFLWFWFLRQGLVSFVSVSFLLVFVFAPGAGFVCLWLVSFGFRFCPKGSLARLSAHPLVRPPVPLRPFSRAVARLS